MDNQTRDGSGKGCRRMLFWSGVVFVVVVFSFSGFVAIRLAGMRTSVKSEIARIASSLPGTGKVMPSGLELLSGIAMVGIESLRAS